MTPAKRVPDKKFQTHRAQTEMHDLIHSGPKSARNNHEDKKLQEFFANSEEECDIDEPNPFESARKKTSRPHFLSGDMDLNETISAGLLSGDDSDDLMGHVNVKMPVSPRSRNVTMIEKFVNDIGYRHQMINLSC